MSNGVIENSLRTKDLRTFKILMLVVFLYTGMRQGLQWALEFRPEFVGCSLNSGREDSDLSSLRLGRTKGTRRPIDEAHVRLIEEF